LARANPTNVVAKRMEQEANKARIKLKGAESKARKVYDEQVQRHNAKRSSLNQSLKMSFRKMESRESTTLEASSMESIVFRKWRSAIPFSLAMIKCLAFLNYVGCQNVQQCSKTIL
jgi:hypothetical protein